MKDITEVPKIYVCMA